MDTITQLESFLVKHMNLIDNNQFEELYEMARIEFPTNGNIKVIRKEGNFEYVNI